MVRIYVGIDDTDSLDSRGTGRLARGIAEELSKFYGLYGVTRHQLYVHPDIPYTSHNSSAVIHIDAPGDADLHQIFDTVKALMLADFIDGSDPGLAVAPAGIVNPGVVIFGADAKRTIVTQARARSVAAIAGIRCEGLGGTEGGVIGAVAGIGLASTGSDGRFLMKGRSRELKGSVRQLAEVLEAGIDRVMTVDGDSVKAGDIDLGKSANPSFVQGKAVLFVEPSDGRYVALKRD